MSTAAVSSNSLYQQLQTYFQTRQSDLQQLGQDLKNGDLTDAQQEFSAIQTLGQGGPFANGDAFSRTERQQDFNAVGQALQSGSVANAQQAFEQLASTFHSGSSGSVGSGTSSTPASTPASNPSNSGSEIIINLGNLTPGEQITIGVNSESNGTEQLTISEGNQQNQSQNPQITLNLNPNRNEEILITLFNSAAQSTTSQASTQSTLNTTA
jgi:hypothetical protein